MLHARQDYNKEIQAPESLIPLDEPVFLLRSQDKFAPELLLRWSAKLRLSGGDPKMAEIVEKHAQKMIEWQKKIVKVPDLPNEKEIFEIEVFEDFYDNFRYSGMLVSDNKITLLELSEIVDRKNYKYGTKGNLITIDNSLLRKNLEIGKTYKVEGLWRLVSNNANNPAEIIVGKIA